MGKNNSRITTDSADSESMAYYIMLRNTIQDTDKLIVTIIHQCVTIIIGALTLALLLFEKIDNPFGATILGIVLTVIACFLTLNSRRRVKLYSDILVQKIDTAKRLEDLLFFDDSMKITQRIEKNVKHAGEKGISIYLRSMKLFYWIEGVLLLYFAITILLHILGIDIKMRGS